MDIVGREGIFGLWRGNLAVIFQVSLDIWGKCARNGSKHWEFWGIFGPKWTQMDMIVALDKFK